jgi:hypothetical protein
LDKFNDFFEKLEIFQSKQNKQRQRGLNNYNILTTVLSPWDEVRLHTRMLYSLLNPSGNHYQGSLFLEAFIEELNIENLNIDLSSCLVHKEYRGIDLYITDEKKHIIIENKIHAHDQGNQIKRYIEIIRNQNAGIKFDDILVVYLSLDRKDPSKYSLGELEIEGTYILKENTKIAQFKSIHYKREVIEWLTKCKFEVQNISNLNESLKQYLDVIKIINNEYKDKAMNLSDYIKNDKSIYKLAIEVQKSIPEARNGIVLEFFSKVINELKGKLGNEWVVELPGDLSKRYGFPFRIYKKSWGNKNSLIFGFEFEKNNFYSGCFGVVRRNDKVIIKADITNHFKEEIKSLDINPKTTAWWLHWEYLPAIKGKSDFAEFVLFDKNAEKDFVHRILQCIDIFENKSGLLTKINKYLSDEEVVS